MTQAIDISLLETIASISFQDFKTNYQSGNNIASSYYSELALQGHFLQNDNIRNYGLLARDVTENTGVNGVIANAYSKAASEDINFEVGSDIWLKAQHSLMQQDLEFRREKIGDGGSGELNVELTNEIHRNAFNEHGLPPNVYTLYTPTQALAENNFDAAQTLFERLLTDNGLGNNILTDAFAIDLVNDWNDTTNLSYYQWLGDMSEAFVNIGSDSFKSFAIDVFNAISDQYTKFEHDIRSIIITDEVFGEADNAYLFESNGSILFADGFVFVEDENGNVTVYVDNSTQLTTDTGTYAYVEILDQKLSAAEQLANFIGEQVDSAAEWFTADDGLQLDFANWFGNNVDALLNGELDADEAFIDFARYTTANRLGNQVFDIIGVDDARNAVDSVLVDIGVGAEEAGVIADSLQQTFQRLAVEFALNDFNFSGNQARDIAVGAVASTMTNHYAGQIFGEGTVSAQASVAGVTTLAIGLVNSGGFNTEDWVNLGAQVGIASASAGIGGSVTTALASLGSFAPIVGTLVGAISGIIFGNLFSSLFGGGGPSFGPGEFPSPQAALATQYQVVKVQDENGNQVDALMAVNPEGSTLIATGIRYVIGAAGADTAVGNGLDNVMQGNGGDDYLEGRDGFDAIFGDAGDDHIVANGGDDVINGGAGNNVAFGGAGEDNVIGEDGEDHLFGDQGDDLIASQGGDDYVFGGQGNDILVSGDGADVVAGGSGDDSVDSGNGNDIVFGGTGNDIIEAQNGHDRIYGGEGNDQISAGDGDDIISAGQGINLVDAGDGDDLVIVLDNNDFVDGGLGDDRIHASGGNNNLLGGFGNDLIVAGDGDDLIDGGEGDDLLVTGDGNDDVSAGAGDDLISITSGNKIISGGAGNDYLIFNGARSNQISVVEDGEDLVISKGDQTVRIKNNDIEMLELEDGLVDLGQPLAPQATSASNTLGNELNAKVASLEETVSSEQALEEQYQLLERISDESYAEDIRVDADNKFYNGPEVYLADTRSYDTLFGSSSYKVYKIRYSDEIDGNDEISIIASINGGTNTADFDKIYNNAQVYKTRFNRILDEDQNSREFRAYTDVWVDGQPVYSHVEVSVTPDGYQPYEIVRSESIDPDARELVFDPSKLPREVNMNAFNRAFWREKNLDENITVGEKILNKGSDLIVGTTVDEDIKGNAGDDVLHGGAGADVISGGSDNDWIYGGASDDILYGGTGQDVLNGEAGNDLINGGYSDDLLYGGDGNDELFADRGNNILEGGAGDDTLNAGLGNDILTGGMGADIYMAGTTTGHNIIIDNGDNGLTQDVLVWGGALRYSRSGKDLILGDLGSDINGSATIKDQFSSHGNNRIELIQLPNGQLVSLPNETINDYDYEGGIQFYEPDPADNTPKNITLLNHSFSDIQSILKTGDTFRINFDLDNGLVLSGHNQSPYIQEIVDKNGETFAGFDYERWSFGKPSNIGTTLKDYLIGNDQSQIIKGQSGDDYLDGKSGDDKLYGGDGHDILLGGDGNDELYGDQNSTGNDILIGGTGNDELYGGLEMMF